MSFLENHYWICNKALTVVSLEVGRPVRGKSTFLNKLFNADFEVSEGRHPICSKAVYIQYNIYKNEDMLVDLIDVAADSL